MSGFDTISFLSDFGHDDEFVGVVHSVIRSISPETRVVDITHGIAPHDVRAGGLTLARAAPYLAAGVVIAVVDPGVGTDRRAVAVEVGHGSSILVGPDNGLLGPAVGFVGGATRAVELTNPSYRLEGGTGPTFDGRDVFAPAAAHLCLGVPMQDLGPEIDPATMRPGVLPVAHRDGDDLVAEILWIDRFGNCQLNITPDDIEGFGRTIQIEMGEEVRTVTLVTGYDHIPGRLGLLVDSSGLVSIAAARASAASDLATAEGSEVRIRRAADADRATTVSPVELTGRGDRG